MAKAKKASRRYSRARRYKRTYRRRWYRRKYSRRSGRRFPKGTEVKSISKSVQTTLMPVNATVSSEKVIQFKPGYAFIIGSSESNSYTMSIPQGYAQGQRVGAKIEPIKLRISGCLSLAEPGETLTDNYLHIPNFWQVRVLVYQVKGANAAVLPDNENYHQLAMVTGDDTGWVAPSQFRKLLMTYMNNGNVNDDRSEFTNDHWNRNNLLGRIPLRRGIGGLCRVLYKKTFWINSQKNPIKQFRFITKCPKRFIYPETMTRDDSNTPETVANNCVYILWMFQPGDFNVKSVPRLNISFNVDLFYTDK